MVHDALRISSNGLLPARGVVWVLRLLCAAGLGVAGFLLLTHVVGHWRGARAVVPFCSGLSWFDCDSVLNSPHAVLGGVPVSGLAVVVYGVMLWWLFWVRAGRSEAQRGRTWRRLLILGWTVLAAGAWFVWVQYRMDQWCAICLVEHAIGVALVGLMWLHGGGAYGGRGRWRWARSLVGLLAGAVLIVGQVVFPVGLRISPVVVEEGDRWVEEVAGGGGQVAFNGGRIVLDVGSRPVLGFVQASRFVVEVMDYTCARCRNFGRLLEGARERLGPDTAVVVMFYPLSGECNERIERTESANAEACAVARIGLAVWLADPWMFGRMHRWLIAHEGESPTAAGAREKAAELIGAGRLEAVLGDGRVDAIVARGLKGAGRLGVRQLPGVFVGDRRFEALPVTAGDLADLIGDTFEASGGR